MEIFPSYNVPYNISVDGGDNISNILFLKHTIVPATVKLSFVIPEIDEKYNIKILMGDNILSGDNIVLHNVVINKKFINEQSIKMLYMTVLLLPYYLVLNIDIKSGNLYKASFSYYYNNIPTYTNEIDVTMCRLQFELKQIIMIINNKINNHALTLDNETKKILQNKLSGLENNLANMTNEKMLEVRNTLKIKFFID